MNTIPEWLAISRGNLRVRDMANLLGCSRVTVYRLVEAGKVPKPEVGKAGLFNADAFIWRASEVRKWWKTAPPDLVKH